MRKISVNRILILVAIYSLAANFVHPVEPTFYQALQMPDWIFGVAYACMSVGSFLFSPMWGKIAEQHGAVPVISIGLFGYALGQYLMMQSTSVLTLIPARLVSGFFTSTFVVGELLYIMENSTEERASRLAVAATISAVGSAGGYMIGGLLGDVSVSFCFLLQVVTLAGAGVFVFLFIADRPRTPSTSSKKNRMAEWNPFRAFVDARDIMTTVFAIFLCITALTMFASTSFDNCFNYFIKDQFGFPPSVNGWVKGAVAIITFVANTTIAIAILKKTKITKSLIYILLVCAVLIIGVLGFSGIVPFLIASVLFFGVSAIYRPLLQAMISLFSKEENQGIYVGVYNSMCAVGSVTGSLAGGFVYAMGSNGPRMSFLLSVVAYLSAAMLAFVLNRMFDQMA